MKLRNFLALALGLYFLALGAGFIGKSEIDSGFFWVGLIWIGIGALLTAVVFDSIKSLPEQRKKSIDNPDINKVSTH
jgi:hypothetical protein